MVGYWLTSSTEVSNLRSTDRLDVAGVEAVGTSDPSMDISASVTTGWVSITFEVTAGPRGLVENLGGEEASTSTRSEVKSVVSSSGVLPSCVRAPSSIARFVMTGVAEEELLESPWSDRAAKMLDARKDEFPAMAAKE